MPDIHIRQQQLLQQQLPQLQQQQFLLNQQR